MKKTKGNHPMKHICGRICRALLLLCSVALLALSHHFSGPAQKSENHEEGLLYTIDEFQKEILTSDNGEICVKIPQWKEFTNSYLTENYGKEKLYMTNDVNYDSMTYELISSWDIEEAKTDILEDFTYHSHDHMLGKICQLTVGGIDIYYLPCYHDIHSKWKKWHYTIWADLGCGQVLKTEITQGMLSEEAWKKASENETAAYTLSEPLNIEGMIEALYTHIEVCSSEGEPIETAYREPLSENEEQAAYRFSFGIVREYKTDAYRETAVCSELIERLYEAVWADTIQELLQQECLKETELSIAEKMDYIKKEETGKLISYDSGNAYARGDHPTKYYLLKGADSSENFLIYSGYDFWEERFDYMWFKCETDNTGKIRAQKGIYIYGADTREHYFLSFQNVPYLCIANRNTEGEIESVVLYDFETPDYIGTVVHIDDSSIRICSYIRNESTYGTEMPWYLYDNHIDSGKEYYAMLELWKVTEYLGESDYLHTADTGSKAYAKEQELTQHFLDTYLHKEINMSWDREQHDVTSFHSASEYGYYYTSWENLYKVYGQPETLAMEAPFSCATLQAHDFEEDIDIIVDKNGKAAICVEGRFFLLEKSAEEIEELRTWY